MGGMGEVRLVVVFDVLDFVFFFLFVSLFLFYFPRLVFIPISSHFSAWGWAGL